MNVLYPRKWWVDPAFEAFLTIKPVGVTFEKLPNKFSRVYDVHVPKYKKILIKGFFSNA